MESWIQENQNESHTNSGFARLPVELLSPSDFSCINEAELMEQARLISDKLAALDVQGSVTQIHPGPIVTTFEVKPGAGIQVSQMKDVADDLCLALEAESVCIGRVPGKATIGIEVPNRQPETVRLRDIIESDVFRKSLSPLTIGLGKSKGGNPFVTDLARMPHLLIAGPIGCGKNAALRCIIVSILYKATPGEVRFILIDQSGLALGLYADIPQLIAPLVTDVPGAENALKWAVAEMESRYKKLALRGVRNIDQYNDLLRISGTQLAQLEPSSELEKPIHHIVIAISNLPDFSMGSKEINQSLSRLADRSHAAGIHMVATVQYPSANLNSDNISEFITAGFLGRICFRAPSEVDSQNIIGINGAEELSRVDDYLFISLAMQRPVHIHSAFVDDKELMAIAQYLRQSGKPAYDDSILLPLDQQDEMGATTPVQDELYIDAVRVVVGEGRASTSLLQRRLSIGYGRAAQLIDTMFHNNIVGPADGSKPREVLVGLDFLDRLK